MKTKLLSKIFSVALLSNIPLLLACTSDKAVVRPTPQQDQQASFDGDAQDSGLIEMSNGTALVSAHFVERYNAMVGVYGAEPEFMPALKQDEGVMPAPPAHSARHPTRGPLFLMTSRALVNFIKMNQWRKMGRVPAAQKPRPGILSRMTDAIIS